MHGNSKPPNAKCKICEKPIRRSPSSIKLGFRIYCSRTCQYKDPEWISKRGRPKSKHKTINRVCIICGKQFYSTPSAIAKKHGKYCSKKCMWLDPEQIIRSRNKPPIIHTEEFKQARREYMTGLRVKEKNPNWKGGMRQLRKLVQDSSQYWEWREAVFQRDNYKDWFSGCTGNLVAHHIIPFSVIIKKNNIKTIEEAMNCKELFDVNNGVTMLKASHTAYHEMYGQTYSESNFAQPQSEN